MSKQLKSTKCISCGGVAFRTDRPYGDFCSMMCALRGIQTKDEKEEERERIREIHRNVNRAQATKPTDEGTSKSLKLK